MSNGLVRKLDDMSQTNGIPLVSGINWNSTPENNIALVDDDVSSDNF